MLTSVMMACGQARDVSAGGSSPLSLPDMAGPKPWTEVQVQDDPDDFHFVVVSDRTCCARPGVFAGAMPKVNLLSPAFVVSVGDLIEGYTENQTQLDREWDEIQSYVNQLEAPFFYTPGNHDMNNAVMANEWERRFGPSYYHFQYKGVLFLVLNSELFGMVGAPDTPVPGPWKQADQMAFVRSVLAQHPDPRWTMVLLHQPLWTLNPIDPDWLEIETLLDERDYTVFAGHFHQYSRVERHNRNFITLATTGGGSSLRGTAFGEFDHVAWVTMRDAGPVIGNLLLDGIVDVDVSNPELLGALKKISDSVVVENVQASDELFAGSSLRVAFSNPTDAPLTVSPSVTRKTNFDIAGLVPLTIDPGATAEVSLQLSVPEPVPYRSLVTAAVQWMVTGSVGDRPVQFPVVKPVLPLSRYRIAATSGPITVDGRLEEWGALPYVVSSQGDILSESIAAEDLSFQFDVREDDENLYVAVNVVDDEVLKLADLIPRAQDSIRVFIDPRAPDRRDASMSAGEAALGGDMAAQIATIVATGEVLADELLGFVTETNAAIESQVAPTSAGYAAEFAIPLALIQAKASADTGTDAPWREARISIGVSDRDAGEHAARPLFWQPYRYGNAALPGSEVFVRPY
jgi:3',5'-cyclic AMP phosphodiesterase CpdA